ncbi:NAD(P)-dependent dehydrogenase, short-chain alcohol dehydrogenase family [Variovorax sp. HW608]|uniref:SDR family NAD(P)-dependent oxidoreductase n=1 Tax=Variovorax sp. HW608 TaxID=1034889 RepID=UPI00081F9130|nr:SDR family oxidoreductase [Variovorax sp. HW608]SCK29710.1 NAD(P)-dependent dehydrogenase, short-chain alcohol dehydrogenase family [Variovorax sp. HW608]
MTTNQPFSGAWLALEDQVAVVTGAASGIGAAVAQSLGDAGAKVALLDLDGKGAETIALQLRSQGRRAIAIECDIASEGSVAKAAQQVGRELGACSVLVNNAGMLRAGELADVSLDAWNQVLAVNLTGYLLCARAFSKPMRDARCGSIVNVASISALHPQTGSGAYSASKAGVLLMSRQMAVEWGPLGVRSNAICPGMIRTALSATFYEEPGFEARRAQVTASRRIGEPQDIADAALFLASPRSAYVNGAELVVDGGMSSMLMDMVPRPGFNRTPATA